MKMRYHILLVSVALLGVGEVRGEDDCGPCHPEGCLPLPSNCKYGATFDRCRCCKVCTQANTERCHIVPDPNGNGVICEWQPSDEAADNAHMPTQLQHLLQLNAFFQASFHRRDRFTSQAEMSLFKVQVWRHREPNADTVQQHDAIPNHHFQKLFGITEKRIGNGESTMGYSTCGLTDYVTLDDGTAEQSSTEANPRDDGKNRKVNILNEIQKHSTRNTKSQTSDGKGKMSSAAVEDVNQMNKTWKEMLRLKDVQIEKLLVMNEQAQKNYLLHGMSRVRRRKHHAVKRMKRGSRLSSKWKKNQNENNVQYGSKGSLHADNSKHVRRVRKGMLKRNKLKNIENINLMNGTNAKITYVLQNTQNGKENNEGRKYHKSKTYDSSNSLDKNATATWANENSSQLTEFLGATISDILKAILNRQKVMQTTNDTITQTKKKTEMNANENSALLTKILGMAVSEIVKAVLNRKNVMEANNNITQIKIKPIQNITDYVKVTSVLQNTQNVKENNGGRKNHESKTNDSSSSLDKNATATWANENSSQLTKFLGATISDILKGILNRKKVMQATNDITQTKKKTETNANENSARLTKILRKAVSEIIKAVLNRNNVMEAKNNITQIKIKPIQNITDYVTSLQHVLKKKHNYKHSTSSRGKGSNEDSNNLQDDHKWAEEEGRISQSRNIQNLVNKWKNKVNGDFGEAHEGLHEGPIPNDNKDGTHKVYAEVDHANKMGEDLKSINNLKEYDESYNEVQDEGNTWFKTRQYKWNGEENDNSKLQNLCDLQKNVNSKDPHESIKSKQLKIQNLYQDALEKESHGLSHGSKELYEERGAPAERELNQKDRTDNDKPTSNQFGRKKRRAQRLEPMGAGSFRSNKKDQTKILSTDFDKPIIKKDLGNKFTNRTIITETNKTLCDNQGRTEVKMPVSNNKQLLPNLTPIKSGSFRLNKKGQIEILSSNVGKPLFEKILAINFPHKTIITETNGTLPAKATHHINTANLTV